MKHLMFIGIAALLLTLLAANCVRESVPAPAPAPAKSGQQPAGTEVEARWETRWERTLAAAKKEGELLAYINIPAEARTPLVEGFDRKFGIKLDVVAGTSADLVTRLNSEYRAGVHQVDIFLGGTGTIAPLSKPLGFLSRLEPMLILPEVKDPGAWFGGRLPFFDGDGMVLSWLSVASAGMIYNTDMVKKGQIEAYVDLLKPEWRDKITMSDPTSPGAGLFNITVLGTVWGVDKTKEYVLALLNQQKAALTRDQRLGVEWVARGKYPVGVWPQTPPLVQFLKAADVPLASPPLKEGKGLGASNGGLAVPTKPAHPNATIIFVNWLLSKEGQTVAARTFAAASTRVDVPPEGVHEMFVVQPGQKYIFQSEEFVENQYKWLEEWKKVIN
ncbi:MAG: extracellular solute-binding protein [Chloroflexi bacterium]|nr:extracellular solute-binding protein [Chloroflexota bacterium]